MKTILLVAGTALVVVGGGALAADHYDQYQNKKQAVVLSQQKQIAELRSDLNKARLVQAGLIGDYNKVLDSCQKGRVAYDKLSAVVKLSVPAPVCTVQTAAR